MPGESLLKNLTFPEINYFRFDNILCRTTIALFFTNTIKNFTQEYVWMVRICTILLKYDQGNERRFIFGFWSRDSTSCSLPIPAQMQGRQNGQANS